MADKQPENNDGFFEIIKKIWVPIAGFLGAITLAYNFYKLWRGDQTTVTYFLAGGGLVVLIIAMIFVITRTKIVTQAGTHPLAPPIKSKVPFYSPFIRNIAKGGIGLVIILAIGGIFLLIQRREERKKYLAELEQKFVVLIAEFEGPEEVYGLRNQIIEDLNADFSQDENIEIISIDEIIAVSTIASEYARELGQEYHADIVIWGWYRQTENPNITIHIENLSPSQLSTLRESETFQPPTTLSELESFEFQQQTGEETSALISFVAGVIEYESENHKTAIQYFDASLETLLASHYSQAIQINPQYAQVYINRGNAYSKLGEYELAIKDYDQATQLNSQFADAYYNRGVVYQILGKYKLAIQDYDKTIQVDSQHASAYNNRGLAYSNLGDNDRAIQDYNQAIHINRQHDNAYYNRGLAYYQLGKYELAIQSYDQAIQINPQDVDAYCDRGNAYYQLGKSDRAIQDYNQAIQINPQYANAYLNRGIAYRNLGKYELAIQDYDLAIQINPQLSNAYNSRGNVYIDLGKYDRAIQDYDQAIQINPQYANAYKNRGVAYLNLGKYELALQDFDQAIQINPQFAEAYYVRGLVYQSLGKIAEAEADFAKYKELTGQDAP